MKRSTVTTPHAPAAIGPYSQGIVIGQGMVFTAGQVAIIPSTGQVLEGDIRAQTKQVLENLAAILVQAGSRMDAVVKTTVYLTDMNDFPAMNEVYAGFFPSTPPARTTVEVSRLPRDVRVEIDAVALIVDTP